jgi:hypothetical protein
LDRIFGRTTRLVLIGGLTLAASCSSALAEDEETWRCTAPNGHYDQNVIPISDKSTVISGRITLHQADFNPEWNSLARISVKQSGPNNGDCHCNGIAVYAIQNPQKAEFHMKANGGDEALAHSLFETPITFKISINPQGVMTVEIGKTQPVVKTVTLIHPEHDTLVMSCSGADVSFLNLDVQ